MNLPRISLVFAALLLALGLAIAGIAIGNGISGKNAGQRTISVKGLSEKEVPASIAIWSLGYAATGNDLKEIDANLGASTKAVLAFLKEAGFEPGELAVQPPMVHDTSMDQREKDTPPPPARFSASQSVLLRTAHVDAVKPAMAASSKLMAGGVVLNTGSKPKYIFDQLNQIKPGMIQEATKNARIAADQFAHDSGIGLGMLRNASQGWFQIEDRDEATPERKLVRVVVEVVYEVN